MRLKSFISLFDWTFLLSMAGFLLWFRLGKFCFVGAIQELYVPFLAIGFCAWSIGWTFFSSFSTEKKAAVLCVTACVGSSVAVFHGDVPGLLCALLACLSMSGLMMLACYRVEAVRSSKLCVNAMASLLLARIGALLAVNSELDCIFLALSPAVVFLAMLGGGPGIVSAAAAPKKLAASSCEVVLRFAFGVLLYGVAMGVFKGGADAVRLSYWVSYVPVIATGLLLGIALVSARQKPCLQVFRATRALVFIGLAAMLSFVAPVAAAGRSLVLSAQFCFLMLFFIVAPRVTASIRGRNFELFGWGFALFFASSCVAEFVFRVIIPENVLTGNIPAFLALVLVFITLIDLVVFKDDDFDFASHRKDEGVHERNSGLRDAVKGVEAEFHLSPREAEVLVLWSNGETAGEIARRLYVSESTVRSHIKSLYSKCDLHSKQELRNFVNAALRESSIMTEE